MVWIILIICLTIILVTSLYFNHKENLAEIKSKNSFKMLDEMRKKED